ncbi:MAG: hypothetical protein ACM3VZ_12015 [Acidobacteriota bacterium]
MQGVKRFGAYVVLALSMLLMQQGALRHALQHSVKDEGAPAHSTLCKDCLSYCASDAVASQAVSVPLLAHLVDQRVATGQPQCGDATALGYLSRAPPASSSGSDPFLA